MTHVIFYFKFMDDRMYLIYNFCMKKFLILSIIFSAFVLPVFAEEEVTEPKKTETNKVKLFNKKPVQEVQEVSTEEQENLSADAMVLYNANDIEGSLKILKSIEDAKKTTLDWLLMGNIYQDKKDIDNAALMYQKSILADKTFYRAYYNLGNLYLEDENAIEAIKLYKQSLKYKYDFAYAHYNIGCAYVKLGELKNAKSSFLRAIDNKKDMAEAYYNLAFVYKKLNNTKKAEQYLKIYNELILRKL